jgi:hypothetical protein
MQGSCKVGVGTTYLLYQAAIINFSYNTISEARYVSHRSTY